ncbi:hypothetical protein [Entomospira culicis]|uniref:Uncharacterized protein n=1 Tax=Entomospira culicis TaxID=2719989 RepID=A0A968GIX9_9SPIO|nr:hypothetical protein [Entomospira culicis]NIZ19688.1 hypothetical protein [Entomospira culicis]NIZ69902.1 hypothetical protein [Entomospira culicis]WDI37007.1 hypothetical protein PVA46_06730 [Entomospira culicis]WDI38636.1 hypothetical protein PVA47_06740 [Entomospira culicis]
MNRFILRSITAMVAMATLVSAFTGSRWDDESVVIYRSPDPLRYGVAPDPQQQAMRDLHDFGLGLSHLVLQYEESGFLTATLMEEERIAQLEALFAEQPTAKASHSPLKFEGFYSAITFDEHELYRITERIHYNRFNHQVATRLEHPHYLYHNQKSGITVEFSIEPTPIDLLLTIRNEIRDLALSLQKNPIPETRDQLDLLEKSYKLYENGHVLRIHQSNRLASQGYSQMEDVMFVATLLGAREQAWAGIPHGNDYLAHVISSLQSHPKMAIFLNSLN